MARRRSRSQLNAMDQVNITPLLDLTFLLLIVFMISMPLMQNVIDVPEGQGNEAPPEYQEVALNDKGEIVFLGTTVSRENLIRELQRIHADNPNATVLLSGNKHRTYGEVMDLYRAIRQSGIANVGLVTLAVD